MRKRYWPRLLLPTARDAAGIALRWAKKTSHICPRLSPGPESSPMDVASGAGRVCAPVVAARQQRTFRIRTSRSAVLRTCSSSSDSLNFLIATIWPVSRCRALSTMPYVLRRRRAGDDLVSAPRPRIQRGRLSRRRLLQPAISRTTPALQSEAISSPHAR